jgi:DNA polymerase-3 subunit delta
MQAEGFFEKLESGEIAPVYLLVGEETFLMDEAWKKLFSKAFPSSGKFFNGERLQAKEIEAATVIERLATMPMFGGRRFIRVDGVENWNKEGREAMESFVPIIPPTACLVMTAASRKNIEGLAKAVETKGKIVQFKSAGGKDAPRWLMERAGQLGKTLSHRAAFFLVETAGANFQTLASELDKICTFVGERERIEAEDIFEAASSQRSFSTFELLDQIRARQAGKAVRSLKSLILAGELPLKILATLAWQIRLVWQVKDALRQGIPESELAKRVGAHPFVVKKAREQSARFSDADLFSTLEAICQTDVAIKSTGGAPEVLLEELVLDLCLAGSKRFAPAHGVGAGGGGAKPRER